MNQSSSSSSPVRTLRDARARLADAGYHLEPDGGGGWEVYDRRTRIARVFSDAALIQWARTLDAPVVEVREEWAQEAMELL